MAWTTVDSDFQGYSLTEMNKFISALNERRLALGQAALTLLTSTDSVPGASVINGWQTWIETNCTSFVVSHDTDGNPLGAGAHAGEASLPFYTDIADVFDHTGLAHSDWRRVRGRALFGYGKATSDDGRAIQLFQDLQAVLNVLVWTEVVSDVDGQGEDNYRLGESSTTITPRAAVLTQAEGDYDADTPVNDDITTAFAGSWVDWYPGWPGWNVGIERNYTYFTGAPPTHCDRTLDFYAIGVLEMLGHYSVNVWDDCGDWGVGYTMGDLYYHDSQGPTADATVHSAKFGSNAVGDYPDWGADDAGYVGWVADWTVVARWNVVGGFTYQ